MDPSEIADLFFGPEDTATAKAQAMANALRGQQQLGQLGMLTGDKVLGGVGKQLFANAGEQQDLIPKAANMRLQRAMEAEKARREQEFQQAQMKHMGAQEQLQRDQMAQGRYTVLAPTATSPGYKVEAKTGIVTPLLDAAPGATPKALTENQQEKQWEALADRISPVRGKGSLLPKYQARIDASGQLSGLLVGPDGKLIHASPQQVREAAMSLTRLISQGQVTEHQLKEFTPDTLQGRWAELKQKVLNEPQDAESQAFLQQMLDTSSRETDIAKNQLRTGQLTGLPAYAHLRGVDRKKFDAILSAAHLDPSTIDDQGLEVIKQAAPGGLAPDKQRRLEELRAKQKAGALK